MKFGTGRNRMQVSHLAYADDILIFTQANGDAQRKLLQCLTHYEEVSGQRVNASKSNFFIHDKHASWAPSIQRIGGFRRGAFPFTYLGVPLYRGVKKNELFWFIRDKIASRLLSWSHRHLSFGGRLLLIKSTLDTIPLHVFQVLEPTSAALQRMEQVMARFFWGSSNDSRKTHWIKWSDCCRPHSEGGLGIRRLLDMVQAFSYKLWWRFREQQSLWARYMQAKYCPRSSPSEVSPSRRHSPVWRRMFQAGQKIQSFMRWVLGNGQISFWDDTWLENVPLRELGNGMSQDNGCVRVRECWGGEEWDEERLQELLLQRNCSSELFEKIRLIPFLKTKNDVCRWTLTGNGNFSTSSAWQLARVHHPENSIYNQFWCKAITPSMGIFLWRLVINRIPVDTKLQWRMLLMASKCRCCKNSDIETADHLFIHSEAARWLWNYFGKWLAWDAESMEDEGRIIPRLRKWRSLFPGTSHLHISSVLPCLIMWFLWLERNACTFQDTDFNVGNIKKRVELQLERLILSGIMNMEHWKGARQQHPLLAGKKTRRKLTKATRVDWLAPDEGWIKVNTDGAYFPSNNKAGGGALIRNSEGKLIEALTFPIEAASPLEAKLKAFELGLAAASRYGANIWMETDADCIVHMLVKGEQGPAATRHVLSKIQIMLATKNVKVSHIAREGNKPADLLATRGCDEQGIYVFERNSAPPRLRALLELDEKGIPNFRFQTKWADSG